ncbi:HepT-like ribonuclease domain-containing protein [Hydrogenimonas sp.]
MSERDRLDIMLAKIEDIEYFIAQKDGKIVEALHDRILKPAIRMQLIALSEDFTRLAQDGAYHILVHFNPDDIKGLNAVRNFIAHDYDSVDDEILEVVLRKHLPILKEQIIQAQTMKKS